MTINLNLTQRKALATALYGLGNISAGALLIGSFVANMEFRTHAFILGMLLLLSTYFAATWLNGTEDNQ